MSDWAAKRFWADVAVVADAGGFGIRLDGRVVKTPSKAPLVVPTQPVAEAIAQEWRAVDVLIDPRVMPYTRSANAAIDKVSVQFDEVAEMLAAYGGSDLLCYRAHGPDELRARQMDAWDPLLQWADATFGARLACTDGIMPVGQPEAGLSALRAPLFTATPFELTALHDLIALSGSLVLALCVTQRRLNAAEAWTSSRVDETWQAEQWGIDEEAMDAAALKGTAFAHAANLYGLLQNDLSP